MNGIWPFYDCFASRFRLSWVMEASVLTPLATCAFCMEIFGKTARMYSFSLDRDQTAGATWMHPIIARFPHWDTARSWRIPIDTDESHLGSRFIGYPEYNTSPSEILESWVADWHIHDDYFCTMLLLGPGIVNNGAVDSTPLSIESPLVCGSQAKVQCAWGIMREYLNTSTVSTHHS